MSDCIFCKIIKGEITAYKIYEDENSLSFLDRAPVNEGHVLVISKEHSSCVEDLSDEALKNLSLAIKKTVKILKDKLGIEACNIIQNNGKVAGQEIFHVHFHIIPRLENDGLKLWPSGDVDDKKLLEIYKKIKN
ncbi:HIT family protein [bacterium]|nr:HIT family protein [bacterium]